MIDDLIPLTAYDAGGGKKPKMFKLLSYAEMSSMPEPAWLIDGLIQQGSTAVMFGKSNSFKSFLAIDIGLSVASGLSWHGHEVVRGDVLFVATEGANGVGRRRIPAWYDHQDVAPTKRRAFLFPKEVRLDLPDEVAALIDAVQSSGAFRLVILDIFGGTMAGSEIEDKTARNWVQGIQRIVRETGATVLTVAHTGWQDDSRARMHTHFWGSFDTRLKVDGDKLAMTAMMTVDRHKDADSDGAWGFRLVPSQSSLVPEIDPFAKVKSPALPVKQQIALDALDDAISAAGVRRAGPDWPSQSVVEIEVWREHFYRHSPCDSDKPEARRQAFKRARDALLNRRAIRFFDDCVWRCFDEPQTVARA